MFDQPPELGEELSAKAFNLGSDARIVGLPLSENPFPDISVLRSEWTRGWLDVHNYWGYFADWPVKLIPEVSINAP